MTGPPSYPDTGSTSQAAEPPPPARPRWKMAALLPSSWQDAVGPYLPMKAGDTIYTVRPEAHTLGPWAGFGVFCLYAAAALAAGFVLIGRRDA